MSPSKSKVWIYLKKIDVVLALCKHCSQEVRYCGNTSNLSKHLKKRQNLTNTKSSIVKQSKLIIAQK